MNMIKNQGDAAKNLASQSVESAPRSGDALRELSAACPVCNAPAGRICWPRWKGDTTPHTYNGKIELLVLSIAANQFTVPLPTGKEVVRAVNSHDALVAALRPFAELAGFAHADLPTEYVPCSVRASDIYAARAALQATNTASGTTDQDS